MPYVDVSGLFVNLLENVPSKIRKWFIVILAVGFLTLLGLLLFDQATPPPVQQLPNPNGYDDLVKAAQMLTSDVTYYGDMNQEELRALVAKNVEGLKLARIGLTQECRVPIEYSEAYSGKHLPELAEIKRLAQLLHAEGKLAEIDNRPADVVRSYLDCIRLGRESARGGILIDKHSGLACEGLGAARLQQLIGQFDLQNCREAIQVLESLETKSESTEDVLRQERAWSRRAYGWKQQIAGVFTYKSRKQTDQKLVKQIKDRQMKVRLLMIDLAARAYELENGERPKTLFDLVPGYLKAIPQDPFTGTNIVYQP